MTWPSINLEASRETRGVREIKGEMREGEGERERERERERVTLSLDLVDTTTFVAS